MIWFLLSVTLIATGGGAQIDDLESCDMSHLDVCVKTIPRSPIGLPRTKEELDAHCFAYNTGMSCMDVWIKRCMPTDGQKILERQIRGAQAVMRFLCNETALRKAYLNEPKCWHRVSADWSGCMDEFSFAAKEISDQAQQLSYFNMNAELCCAREEFLMCVAHAARGCTQSASTLLKRLALVLAQDMAVCSQQSKTYCAASSPPAAAPILIALYNVIFFFPRF